MSLALGQIRGSYKKSPFTDSGIQTRRHFEATLTLKTFLSLTTLTSFHLAPPYADDVVLNVTSGVRWDYNAWA